uniref:Uncharacterized protein n=1 Tax=uncultured Helicobacter sp. TaxID=175537 RepID=A0A650EK43_9HELI|nr:hypothetical protein Helico4rc_2190 [uncultured Helicobacter sp.]
MCFIFMLIFLYEKGTEIPFNKNFNKNRGILTITAYTIIVITSIVFLVVIIGFEVYRTMNEGDYRGLIVLGIAGIFGSISWYLSRYRRWWVRFISIFLREDEIKILDLKPDGDYYKTLDKEIHAAYFLYPKSDIFEAKIRIWLDPQNLALEARRRIDLLTSLLNEHGICANIALIRSPQCIHGTITAEINYKSLNAARQIDFRSALIELSKHDYTGEYFVKYQGKLGTLFFASSSNGISRAIREEPRFEHYYTRSGHDPLNENDDFYVSYYRDWTNGVYELISKDIFFEHWRAFFTRWWQCTDEEKLEIDAISILYEATFVYFKAVIEDDKDEQINSQWDIENAAQHLITHHKIDTIKLLLETNDSRETIYWAARLFKNILPTESKASLIHLIKTLENILSNADSEDYTNETDRKFGVRMDYAILSHAKQLLNEW